MNAINLATEAGAQGGYSITGATGQDPLNKLRAFRRLNMAKADIISRFGGKWDSNYKEGWLALVPLYTTGTATFTPASRTVTGSGTSWDSTYQYSKILGPDGSYYKIASVVSATSLVLTQPYQGTTAPANSYQIWKDEYRLHPEALTLGGFVDYAGPSVATETWPRNMKQSYPKPVSNDAASLYTVIGRERATTIYSTGTITGSINDTSLVGVGTLWQSNIEPGYEIVIGAYTYHVKRVNSDTSLELYQKLVVAVTGTVYTATGKNALIVRFLAPTSQRIVNYWYWTKDYPLVNDNDEDWICEMYPKVILNGTLYFDYLDKNDVARASTAYQVYENSIKDMKVALDSAMTGPRELGYDIPDSARD